MNLWFCFEDFFGCYLVIEIKKINIGILNVWYVYLIFCFLRWYGYLLSFILIFKNKRDLYELILEICF